MSNLPSILVVSCSKTKPKSIIKLITKEDPPEDSNGLIIQPWNIDTKYYTALVNVIGLPESYERSSEFNEDVDAVIIHLDTNNNSGLEDLKKWDCLDDDCQPEIKLLICNYCDDNTNVTIDEATNWCLTRGYEFIVLYPEVTKNNEPTESSLIEEKFGLARIIEALQANAWSNLKMKNQKPYKPSTEAESSSKAQKSNKSDDQGDNFSELYTKFSMMKTDLQSISSNQRKQCAEELVTAFWKAIGGDEEEILDL